MPVKAMSAFFALGANVLAAIVLLVLNGRNRAVRWCVLFMGVASAILLFLGMSALAPTEEFWRLPLETAGHLAPAAFLAFALVQGWDASNQVATSSLLIGALLLPLTVSFSPWHVGVLAMAYHAVFWGTAGVLLWNARTPPDVSVIGRRWLVVGIMAIMAVLVIGLFTRNETFYAIAPLLTVAAQILVFVGVSRLQLYEIEVRAGRSGQLAAAAAERERLALLGELGASVAHEVRNPLTGVRSLAQRIADDDIDDAKRRRYAGIILDEVTRVDRIVANLLAFSRKQIPATANESASDLASLVADLELLVAPRARRSGITLAFDAPSIHAAAPRELMAQVLLNFLINAIAHSPPRGRVELRAEKTSGKIRLTVRDYGPGVPPDRRAAIFEPFQSGGDGTGLGLAVARRLAREQGWGLGVGDADGGGAEFWVEVPGAPTNGQSAATR